MADFNNRALRSRTGAVGYFDAGLRSYMLRVYNYMLVAMLVTGAAAYGIFQASVTTDPAQAAANIAHGLLLTSFGVTLFATPLRWVIIFAPLAAVLFLQYRLRSVSVAGAQIAFWVFSALMGLSMA